MARRATNVTQAAIARTFRAWRDAGVPAEKLLVFEVREGWGPLCEFLGVEEPAKPFPRLNDREEFPRMMRRQMATALAPALGRALVALSAVLAALLMLRMILPRSKRDR